MRKPGPVERFWSNVDKSGECWIWTAGRNRAGYGQFAPTRDRKAYAHRMAYELLVGPIPEGLTLDHLCRNPACVNPAHLEPVTNKTNILRGFSPAAQQHRRTACIRGHAFDSENTYVTPEGARQCRACRRAFDRRRRGVTVTENGDA